MRDRPRRIVRAEATHREMAKAFGVLARVAWPSTDAGILEVGTGAAVFMGPGMYLNRVVGLGMDDAVTIADLDAIEAFYAARNHPVEIQLCSEADAALLALLAARGYRLTALRNAYAVDLARVVEAPSDPALDLHVAPVTRETFPTWQAVHGAVFTADSARRAVNDAFCEIAAQIPGAHDAIASLAGTPAAVCSLIVREGVGSLGGMATLPGYRNRGVQAALLRYRLLQAQALGCDLAITAADPGSASARNVERAGFQLLMVYAFLTKPTS